MIVLLGLLASLQLSPDSVNQLTGTWLNQGDPSTVGITQIVIRSDSGVVRAHAWGSCEPIDCDDGVANVTSTEGTPTAIFDHGFAVTTMHFVPLPDDKLLVIYKAEFRDDPDSKDQDHTELFEREKPSQNDERGRKLLKKVGEAYSNLGAAEFQVEYTYQSTDETSATRLKSLIRLLISSSGRWREERSGSGERKIKVCDGKTQWTYFPESNQYTAYPAGKERLTLVDLYRSLDQLRGSISVAASESIGDVHCTVVKMEGPGSVRTLWIDPKTNLVLKDKVTKTSSTATGSRTRDSVMTFSVARALPSVDEQLFSFDAQKVHAKSRDEVQRQARTSFVGTAAPDFTLFDLENKQVRLSELKGKVVLLDFWATWCAPCQAALPNVELLHREFKDSGLIVLGVDDEEAKDQGAFLKKFGYTFRSLMDETEQVKNLYGVAGIPTTVLIDREGTIQVFELGGSSYAALREALRKLGIS